MKVTADGREIMVAQIVENFVNIGGEDRPSLAIAINGGVTKEDVEALKCGIIIVDEGYKTYKGFTGYIDTEVLLYRPTDADLSFDRVAEIEQRMIALEQSMNEKQALHEEKEADFNKREAQMEKRLIEIEAERDEAYALVQKIEQQLTTQSIVSEEKERQHG